ncbi:MAG: UPF0280 family protein [bacterium]|nr:UPF0280 family protein [bacterium]
MYEVRTYQQLVKEDDLVITKVIAKETELFIKACVDLEEEALNSLLKYRRYIEDYINQNPLFETTLSSYSPNDDAPEIVKEMAIQASKVNVGPMASVAGAIAEYVGKDLIEFSDELIIENGGDIYMNSKKTRNICIFAGESIFSEDIKIKIESQHMPIGVCTSSGSVGHSISFGTADAVTVLSKSAVFADAAATSIANMVETEEDVESILNFSKKIHNLNGVIIIKNDTLGAWGDFCIERRGGIKCQKSGCEKMNQLIKH